MQAERNNEGRVAAGAHCGPANHSIEMSTSGTIIRYRFSSPMTRHARSLGGEDDGGVLAGISKLFFGKDVRIQRDPAPRAVKILYQLVKR